MGGTLAENTFPAIIDPGIQRRFTAARAEVADGTCISVLHIGAEQTVVASGHSSKPETALVLATGSRKTAADYFKQNPPAPADLEAAIHAVEDQVVRIRSLINGGNTLLTTDGAVRDIARMAAVADQPEMTLNLDALERVFARLSAVTLGRPASREGIPEDLAFAARLLILREFMHHLEFPAIRIVANTARSGPT